MKPMNIWLQFGLALLVVAIILIGFNGLLSYRRSQALANYEDNVECKADLDPALIERGKTVYQSHCIACHGSNLEGTQQWQIRLEDGSSPPPPLNAQAHAWQHSDASLIKTISNGRNPGKLSPMPAFGESLSSEEIRAVVEYIKSHWGASQLNQQDLLNQ